MKKKTAVIALALLLCGGLRTTHVVHVGDASVEVAHVEGDGLEDLVSTEVSIGPAEALAACTIWDVRDTCCPAGCAAKKGPNWPKADDILRGCMRGLGCSEDDVKSASVFMKCDCK